MDDFNPYAAPEVGVSQARQATEDEEGRGVWRDNGKLVMAKIALLPARCVKCNEPAAFRLNRSLSWHTPWLYLLIIFPGLLIYIIVALIVRKTAKIAVPLCEVHHTKRSKNIQLAWLLSLAGIALLFSPVVITADWVGFLILAGVVLFLFGLIFGSIKSQVVTPARIDDLHVWLNKVSPLYLADLPALPFSDGSQPPIKPKLRIDEL